MEAAAAGMFACGDWWYCCGGCEDKRCCGVCDKPVDAEDAAGGATTHASFLILPVAGVSVAAGKEDVPPLPPAPAASMDLTRAARSFARLIVGDWGRGEEEDGGCRAANAL